MIIVVLGSGPAGLMAAQGAADAFSHVARSGNPLSLGIISHGDKSPLYGSQYLHEPIPGVTPDDSVVLGYQLRGNSDDYRRKVYGSMWIGTVSPEDLAEQHRAWDIRATYDLLWDKWSDALNAANIDPITMNRMLTDRRPPHLVINSIPRSALCHGGHVFGATEVWAAGDAPELGIYIPYACPRNMVVCNGEDNPAWYRMSNVFGRTTVEWPGSIAKVPVTTAARVQKPTQHNCDCWSESSILHVGRYGEWSKGVLSHTAYHKAYNRVEEMLNAATETTAHLS